MSNKFLSLWSSNDPNLLVITVSQCITLPYVLSTTKSHTTVPCEEKKSLVYNVDADDFFFFLAFYGLFWLLSLRKYYFWATLE
jgi:hypothetical protein